MKFVPKQRPLRLFFDDKLQQYYVIINKKRRYITKGQIAKYLKTPRTYKPKGASSRPRGSTYTADKKRFDELITNKYIQTVLSELLKNKLSDKLPQQEVKPIQQEVKDTPRMLEWNKAEILAELYADLEATNNALTRRIRNFLERNKNPDGSFQFPFALTSRNHEELIKLLRVNYMQLTPDQRNDYNIIDQIYNIAKAKSKEFTDETEKLARESNIRIEFPTEKELLEIKTQQLGKEVSPAPTDITVFSPSTFEETKQETKEIKEDIKISEVKQEPKEEKKIPKLRVPDKFDKDVVTQEILNMLPNRPPNFKISQPFGTVRTMDFDSVVESISNPITDKDKAIREAYLKNVSKRGRQNDFMASLRLIDQLRFTSPTPLTTSTTSVSSTTVSQPSTIMTDIPTSESTKIEEPQVVNVPTPTQDIQLPKLEELPSVMTSHPLPPASKSVLQILPPSKNTPAQAEIIKIALDKSGLRDDLSRYFQTGDVDTFIWVNSDKDDKAGFIYQQLKKIYNDDKVTQRNKLIRNFIDKKDTKGYDRYVEEKQKFLKERQKTSKEIKEELSKQESDILADKPRAEYQPRNLLFDPGQTPLFSEIPYEPETEIKTTTPMQTETTLQNLPGQIEEPQILKKIDGSGDENITSNFDVNIGKNKPLSNHEIDSLLRYIVNKIAPHRYIKVYETTDHDGFFNVVKEINDQPLLNILVYNTHNYGEKEGHWKVLIVDLAQDMSVEFYDSLAEDPDDKEIESVHERLEEIQLPIRLKFKINDEPDQNFLTNRCGLHCILFILDRIHGYDFKQATKNNDDNQVFTLEKYMNGNFFYY